MLAQFRRTGIGLFTFTLKTNRNKVFFSNSLLSGETVIITL